jgi:hypothetical protein
LFETVCDPDWLSSNCALAFWSAAARASICFLLSRVGRYKPSDGRLLLLIFAMLFEELVEQHRVHRFITHTVRLSLLVADHQIGVHLFDLLAYEAELQYSIGIKFVFVVEGF